MENKQREQALELMGKTGIAGTGRSFGVEHLEGVQAFWDKEYPDMFRIVAFDTKRGLKPVFKSENVRKYEVCVISDNGHWDGMKSVSRPERHTIECRERCKNCCRMGFGYPCKKESGPDLHCDACNKDFYSEGCFEEHKKKTLPKYRIVAYDMETAASEEREHIPNLISAAHTCTDCCEEKNKECDICVPGPRLITWSAADGIDPLSEFIDWILGFKNADTIAFAQYGGRYDSHFVLTGLVEKGYAPEVSMADLKIYQIQMGKLYIRDFWMLSQNKLADLPKTLELGIPAKLYFPHKYNKNENFGKKLSHIPPFEDYCPGTMTEEGYGKFATWYEENKNTEFELGQQLKVYCENDVEILMAAILKFRRLFLDITKDDQTPQGFDILKHNMTIASAVMSVFRAKFLKGRHIPIIPEGGFEKAENQSKIAVKYFEWLSYRDGVKVRHAGNGGEVEFGGMKVDCVIGAQKKIIEDAYSGGRTMPFCLFAEASENVEIAMFDIISLYPSVNYDTPYPVGIPKIVKRDEDVLWTEPEDVPYDGLLKVKVISPKSLMYPLLPVHVGGRLLFPLCGTCGKKEKKEFVLAKDEKKCAHNEEERALLGTFTSIELRKALELGYKVTHFYRAYHFEEFDNQLFKGPKRDGRVISQDVSKNYEPVQQKGIIDRLIQTNIAAFGHPCGSRTRKMERFQMTSIITPAPTRR
uniref:DNA-directed DNA polymerase n=1 Tax=Globodera rostochiensis TaxID=31243 RepID=A0A914I684_GLORO